MMFITADQILAHLVGDYILQSDWMANEKAKRTVAAALHAAVYTLPFLLLTHSVAALVFIAATHFLIDRFRLARYVVWAKNLNWSAPVTATGYSAEKPAWLAVWLYIIADNTLHLICNGIALRWLA